jgi:hypothetical protein
LGEKLPRDTARVYQRVRARQGNVRPTLPTFDGSQFSGSLGALDLAATGQGPISVVTRPGHDGVVVAWTEQSNKLRVKVARFDCKL